MTSEAHHLFLLVGDLHSYFRGVLALTFGLAAFAEVGSLTSPVVLQTMSPRTVLSDVILVISCGYEDNSEWGKEIGWIYGSITEDIVTGMVMHTRGWRSIYCSPPRPAFKVGHSANFKMGGYIQWAGSSWCQSRLWI